MKLVDYRLNARQQMFRIRVVNRDPDPATQRRELAAANPLRTTLAIEQTGRRQLLRIA